jgi:hypothetical protein
VFLASPDDVKGERVAAEELIAELNKIIGGRLGWSIWLHKWEDTTPAFGRPQEIINEAVDGCDLFIGLLWKRWGQPSGKYSSGFEEEYERARSRRKETGAPEIWLVFKRVDEESLKDPGQQLGRVLEFRKNQSDLGEVLYREVNDVNEWKSKLNNWLLDYILKLHSAASEGVKTPAYSPSLRTSAAPPGESAARSVEAAKAHGQLQGATESLVRVVQSGDLDLSREGAQLLEEFDVARLFLLCATWMFRRYTGETLGAHEVNLLYKHRERLGATPSEQAQLFRAIVADEGDVIPGWFWFERMAPEDVRDWLLRVSSEDSSADVRRSAVKLLRASRIDLPKDLWPALPILDDSEFVRAEVYSYLGEIGDGSTAESLEEISSKDHGALSSVGAREARLSILLRLRPAETFSEVIQSGVYLSEERIRQLGQIATKVGDDVLLRAVENESEPVRGLALTELARRSRLGVDVAEKLTKDPSLAIREMAFMELARRGQALDLDAVRKSLTDQEEPQGRLVSLGRLLSSAPAPKANADAVILAFYKSQSSESVLQAVDWFSIDGTLAYKSLALDHYDTVRDTLRSDLQSGFQRIREQSVAAVGKRFGEKFAANVVDQFSRLENFIRSQFIEAALSGLAVNGEPSDVEIGRQYLNSETSSVKLAAVRIVTRFGTADDTQSLLQISENSWGEARAEAGLAALRLSSQPFQVARELSRSNDANLSSAGFGWLYGHSSAEVDAFFRELLEDENAVSRERAIYFFSESLKEDAIGSLLASQFEKPRYYYNVVSWLDRLLYSPQPLRSFFRRKLLRRAAPSTEVSDASAPEPTP